MGFAESMKGFVEAVEQCASARADFLAGVTQKTERLLEDAQATMRRIGQEHRQRADQVHADLNASRRQRHEQVQGMKAQIHERFEQMRRHLHETLEAARKNREEAVHTMMQTFQTARQGLANDLDEAGRVWRRRGRR